MKTTEKFGRSRVNKHNEGRTSIVFVTGKMNVEYSQAVNRAIPGFASFVR